MTHRCGCGATWGGANTSHCGGCHQTFSAVGPFDKHRKNFTCLEPAAVGLAVNARGYWALPGDGSAWWKEESA